MQFTYTSTAGINVNLPANIHKMIRRGANIDHVNGGKLNKRCVFVAFDASKAAPAKVDATIQAAKVNAVKSVKPAKTTKTGKVTKVAGKKSNADLMREFVAKAKKTGKTLEDAIAYGINDLGQNKSQAKNYATSIWNGK